MIAISYRREDSLPITGRLYDRLQVEFGRGKVFMDFDSIPYGVDFREHIKEMIDQSKVLVAMIGPDWVGKRKHRERRIDDPTDFVRIEIAYALNRDLPIIPVLVNNAQMPGAAQLPKEIEGLAFRNALTLDVGIDFHHHAERLVVAINRILTKSVPIPTVIQEAQAAPPPSTPPTQASPPPAEITLKALPEPTLPKTPAPPPKTLAPVIPPPPSKKTSEEIEKPKPPTSPPAQPPPTREIPETIAKSTPPLEPATPPPKPPTKPSAPVLPKPPAKPSWITRVGNSISRLQDRVMADYVRTKQLREPGKQPSRGWNWKKISGLAFVFVSVAIVAIGIWYFETFQAKPTKAEKGLTEKSKPVIPPSLTASPTAPTGQATLRIDSTPWGAAYEVIDAKGNHYTGVTPSAVYIAIGTAQVIYKSGNQEHRETVSVASGSWSSIGWTVPEQAPAAVAENSITPVATISPASPTPAVSENPSVQNGGAWQARISDFVRQFVAVNQSADADATVGFYAPNVDYFGGRGKDHPFILRDIQKYNGLWPARHDSIEGDVQVQEKVPNQQYRADFKLNLYAENPKSADWTKGQVAMILDVNIIDGVPKIVAINEKRLQRPQNGRGKGPRPPDMEPPGPITPAKLTKVVVKKYGFFAMLPRELFPDAEAKLADGATDRLTSLKGCATVTFSAPQENIRKVFDDYVNQFQAAPDHRTIDYKVVKDSWFAVSGSSKTTGYYVKGVRHGDNVFVMELDYVGAVCRIPASMVAQMSHTFNGETDADRTQVSPTGTAPQNAEGQKLVLVKIKKYGVSAALPPEVFPNAETLVTNGGPLRGTSWSGRTTLRFFSTQQSLNKAYADYVAKYTTNYKVLKGGWFAVSGDLGAVDGAYMGFYVKGVKKGNQVIIMDLEYQDDDFPFSEETFNSIVRSFTPN